VLIGNADAHGKNFSLLYRAGERRLAPFYDMICTLAWPELSTTPAMKIGKSDSIENITPVHWQKMTQETRLSWPMLRERMEELGHKTLNALAEPGVRSAADDNAIFERVAGIIRDRALSVLQGLRSTDGL